MKKIMMTVFLLTSLIMACRKSNGPALYDLGVVLQGEFVEDKVQVYIDGQTLFNGKAKTDLSVGIAGSIGTTNTEGNHTIKVIVNNNLKAIESFEQHSNLYITVDYNRSENKISFGYSAIQKFYN